MIYTSSEKVSSYLPGKIIHLYYSFLALWFLLHFRQKETVPTQQGIMKNHSIKMYRYT